MNNRKFKITMVLLLSIYLAFSLSFCASSGNSNLAKNENDKVYNDEVDTSILTESPLDVGDITPLVESLNSTSLSPSDNLTPSPKVSVKKSSVTTPVKNNNTTTGINIPLGKTYSVTTKELTSGSIKYKVYTPSNLGSGGVSHPVVLWGNGSGTSVSVYSSLLKGIAKYGYVVIGPDITNAGSGVEMLDGLKLLQNENNNTNSFFYNKLNMSKIGAAGHSQGGGGAMNCSINSSQIDCIVSIQGAWNINASKIKCPTIFMPATEDSLLSFSNNFYNSIQVSSIYAELNGANHISVTIPGKYQNEIIDYSVRWFNAYLNNNGSLSSVYNSLNSNSNWVNVKKK